MRPQPLICVRDVEASSSWYQRLLGCESAHGGPNYERLVHSGKLLRDFPSAEVIDNNDLVTTPCTVLVPAALERVINDRNAGKLRCRILAEAANGPTTVEGDAILARSEIFVIPDVLCNAGGVTVSYFEWVQDLQQLMWSEEQVNQKLQELMLRAFHQVGCLLRVPPQPQLMPADERG